MRPVYQTTGASRGQNGDCFQACLASMLGRRLAEVPNFLADLKNGAELSEHNLNHISAWLKSAGCGGYIEFGFQLPLAVALSQVKQQAPDAYYMLTGCTDDFNVHTVVCKGNLIVHDPATSPGHTVLKWPCRDGFYRIGLLLLPV